MKKRETRRSITSAHFQETATEKFLSSLCFSFAIIVTTYNKEEVVGRRRRRCFAFKINNGKNYFTRPNIVVDTSNILELCSWKDLRKETEKKSRQAKSELVMCWAVLSTDLNAPCDTRLPAYSDCRFEVSNFCIFAKFLPKIAICLSNSTSYFDICVAGV